MSDSTLTDWLPALERVTGKAPRRSGDEYRSPCPAHGGNDDNLSVTERDGRVLTTCHSHGCAHEDIRVATFGVNGTTYQDRDRPPYVSPGPDRSWNYYNADGSLHLTVIRSNTPNGKRIRRELSGVKPPHPIYAVREVLERQGDPVLVVEGEKAADAAAKRFPGYVVTTSCGGSKQAKQSDWKPVAGREVVIWPDADDPGLKYAADVAALTREAGAAEVRIVELPAGLPKSWDLADAVPTGTDIELILESRPMLPVVSLGELYAEPDAEVDWLVDGLLPSDGISLLVAPPKVGKSTLVRCLAVTVADGRGWWLGRAVKAGTVLHLALEERRSTVRDHYRSLNAPENSIYAFVGMAPAQKDRLRLLRETVRAIRPALVIIDPLFRYAHILDGNNYAETVERLGPFIDLARSESTHVLLVHHARKGGGEHGAESLGSTGLCGSVDTFMSLSRNETTRNLYAFGRDGVEIEKTVLRMDEHGWVTAAGTKHQAGVRDVMREVLDFIGESPKPVSGPEVREGVSRGKPVVREALNKLVADGDLVRTGNGPKVRYCDYRDQDSPIESGPGPDSSENTSGAYTSPPTVGWRSGGR